MSRGSGRISVENEVDKLSCLQDVSVLPRASHGTAEMSLIQLNPSIRGHLNACVLWKNLICACVCEEQALYKGRESKKRKEKSLRKGFKKRVSIKHWWPEVEEEEMGMWKGKIADNFLCFLMRMRQRAVPSVPRSHTAALSKMQYFFTPEESRNKRQEAWRLMHPKGWKHQCW